MTTMNITLDQVDEQMKRLQEIKMFLESVTVPKKNATVSSHGELSRTTNHEQEKPEMNLVIHEYWNK